MLANNYDSWQIGTFERGAKISSDTNTLWLIKRGVVKVNTYDLEGRAVILGYWGQADVVGQSLIRISPYEIECLTPVAAFAVPERDWYCLAREIQNCYQDGERLLYILGQNSLEERLLELLIYLATKFGINWQDSQGITLPFSYQELGSFLRSTRASIIWAMNQLKTKQFLNESQLGLIVLQTRQIPSLNCIL